MRKYSHRKAKRIRASNQRRELPSVFVFCFPKFEWYLCLGFCTKMWLWYGLWDLKLGDGVGAQSPDLNEFVQDHAN